MNIEIDEEDFINNIDFESIKDDLKLGDFNVKEMLIEMFIDYINNLELSENENIKKFIDQLIILKLLVVNKRE